MDSAPSSAEKVDGMEIESADQNTAANLGSSPTPDRSTQTDSNHAVTSQLQTSQHSTSVLVKANDPPTLTSLEITDIVTFMNKYENYKRHLDNDGRHGAGPSSYPQSVDTMIEPTLLDVILDVHLGLRSGTGTTRLPALG